MKLFKNIDIDEPTGLISKVISWMLDHGLFYISLLAFLGVIVEEGFKLPPEAISGIQLVYVLCIFSFIVTLSVRVLTTFIYGRSRKKILFSEYFLFAILIIILFFHWLVPEGQESKLIVGGIASDLAIIRFHVIILFLIEFSKRSLQFQKLDLNPALLFTGSFMLLILIGTLLLMLPKATSNGISLIDALFTSTSAVCVTGLAVLDTSKDFTHFGQVIILILIQIGGLGIMTFTSFFGFFFKRTSSIENTLFIQDFINEKRMSKIISTTLKIISVTLLIELAGSILIFITIHSKMSEPGEAVWFSVFHSISAFCNAGFSTLAQGLYQPIVRDAYLLHLIIAALIILGGIGFPVIFDVYSSFKYAFREKVGQWSGQSKYRHRGRHLTVHTKIVLVTTTVLLVLGFFMYLWSEQHNTLVGLSWPEKIAVSIFGSVTPRTAGFNTVDMSKIAVPTMLVYLILMWIGASPGSTGGGLKTTTFAVAVLNTLSVAKHRRRVELFRREITNESVRKAFSVIIMSFLVIGLSVFFVSLYNPELSIIAIAFECFSAFSTVGLSLGITGDLAFMSKVVIIITMFIGRVGTLTILIALIRKAKAHTYQYPYESVFIT
ncbi:TrkH family potassium uptake protein [Fulvivirga ligni]|uniref:TrkH family potassium uptake protein n=1 Tax=Fulvivirga ligni TaxID=2904246 RepID=UPI001F2C8F23|nr:potassium transporter TrkG [Fulvivirga ligni]UII19680.1 ATPase [Fulvivirga ligni]